MVCYNSSMYLIVGLGNPGEEYKETRHNVGYAVIDEIRKLGNSEINEAVPLFLNKPLKSEIGTMAVGKAKITVVKPVTYMNNSGLAVKKIISQFRNFAIPNLIIIHDDITLDLGTVKISKGAGAGNHNGVQSIIDHLKTQDFVRVRCGIGRGNGTLTDVVLSKFTQDEHRIVGQMISRATETCIEIVRHGVEKAMNRYN